jgi:hypothetical protein
MEQGKNPSGRSFLRCLSFGALKRALTFGVVPLAKRSAIRCDKFYKLKE